MKAPISLCLIVKNEPLLENLILSIKDYVSEIVIVDTGSTDGTDIIAKKYADKYERYTACNDSETGLIEDFSQARDRSYALATQPWVMWADADDEIVGGENLLKITNEFGADKIVSIMFPYEYSYNEDGTSTCTHYRERLVNNKNCFHWLNPVHEVLVHNNGTSPIFIIKDEVMYKHRRQYGNKVAESGRNLRILRKYFEKHGDSDARQLYYLGLECYNSGLVDEAIERLTKYIDVSGWDDERCMACLKLVDIYIGKGEYEKGLTWAFKIIALKEIKMRPVTETHDYEFKVKNAKKFIAKGDKVKFTIRFKGRELQHSHLGNELMAKIKEDMKDIGKVELHPKFDGKQMIMVIQPL